MKIAIVILILALVAVQVQSFAITDYLSENDIQYCKESYQHYLALGEYEFVERERRTMESRVCVHLYGDPVWDYTGKDRMQKLLERGNYYVNIEIEKSRIAARTGTIERTSQPPTDLQKAEAKILEQEKTIRELEKKIEQKDQIILEQVRVIMQLVQKTMATWYGIIGNILV
ncbi:hypothetical protein [Candidatus Nitrosotenuis uzonensis]|uniref:Uncharacterized protein n=1 Tax=Candidatus Nitrosotenuis uzonensis TaxID=1407055 RepID=A0A812F504_9ARCH|nr:hypothetical protein [Candidatus Nitrosotenuis uzonensis]MCA2003538.1 hypothetical protein [Candidatus Nitrosotenuis sp.]CAE6498039.1 conserved exported hypothetical protein [Candidatus Nitrosotenuis uzonensis]